MVGRVRYIRKDQLRPHHLQRAHMYWAKQTMMVFESPIWVWAGIFKAIFFFGRWGLMEEHFRPHQLHISCMMLVGFFPSLFLGAVQPTSSSTQWHLQWRFLGPCRVLSSYHCWGHAFRVACFIRTWMWKCVWKLHLQDKGCFTLVVTSCWNHAVVFLIQGVHVLSHDSIYI